MPSGRAPYPAEFREEMIRLVRAGHSPGSLSRESEPSEQTIRNRVNQADVDNGLFGNEWGVGDLPGGVGIHQKGGGVLTIIENPQDQAPSGGGHRRGTETLRGHCPAVAGSIAWPLC